MEAIFFKFAFFILIGLALLGLLTMATVAIVFWLSVVWSWLSTRLRSAKARHAHKLAA